MLRVARFTFNPFAENSFIVDDGRHALIVDPGCWNRAEERQLEDHLATNALEPVRVVNTHGHIDHVMGNAWAQRRYGLAPWIHHADLPLLKGAANMARVYGIPFEESPDPAGYLEEGKPVQLGGDQLEVIHLPGHAPGHVGLFHLGQRFILSGDVLFQRSIGRTDLPGGDLDILLSSIKAKLLPLGDDVVVHCGHGPDTTIGDERRMNPFLR
ncbi:MAG: MBL fold metallo-hydrolase [Flavobacteriales bacterium]|nr:MBL fold metallo-hydrolase [Flavobacteriales bacterium]